MTRKTWEAFGLVVLIIAMIACGSTWDWQMRHADLMKARAEGYIDGFRTASYGWRWVASCREWQGAIEHEPHATAKTKADAQKTCDDFETRFGRFHT